MSELDRIYQKYIGVFHEIGDAGTWIDLAAVRYALRAALRELAGPNPDRQGGSCDQHQYEWMAKQIESLNDWLLDTPSLAHDPHIDTAEAMIAAAEQLRGTVARMRVEMAAAIDERNAADQAAQELEEAIFERDGRINTLLAKNAPATASKLQNGDFPDVVTALESWVTWMVTEYNDVNAQLVATDANNAKLVQELASLRSYAVAELPHGYGVTFGTAVADSLIVAPMSALQSPVSTLALAVLSPETADYWEGLMAGRWTWRSLSNKRAKLEMVRHIISLLPHRSQSEFNDARPGWMPTATAHCSTFGVSWAELVDLANEIDL